MFEEFKCRMTKETDLVVYSVKEEDILNAEERMGFQFPDPLRKFYQEVGYGFIKATPNFHNRIMPPSDVADFVCGSEEYQYVDKSIYDENELVFMQIAYEDFLTIDYKNHKEGQIKYFGDVIADTLVNFLNKILKKPDFYINQK